MIITIAGTPGSGKTSVAKELAKRLNYTLISAGDRLGIIAKNKGLTIDELMSGGDEADILIDNYQKKLGETEDNIIVEGKLAWFLIPKSFKILVTCDENEGARRIFSDQKYGNRPDEPNYATVRDTKKINAERVQRFVQKFKRLYGVEKCFDPSHFDFVLDTTNAKGPMENADKIMAALPSNA